jgi:peptide deformylase
MKSIVQKGDPVLRAEAKPVPEKLFGGKELRGIIQDMTEALDKEPDGVALAAPQIGISYRIFIVRIDRTIAIKKGAEEATPTPVVEVYINPEIIKRSRKKQTADEGCLSVRGIYGTTRRHERATVRARKEGGTRFTRGAGGLLAQIFEHEMDHLNGILFIDNATDLVELPSATKEGTSHAAD